MKTEPPLKFRRPPSALAAPLAIGVALAVAIHPAVGVAVGVALWAAFSSPPPLPKA